MFLANGTQSHHPDPDLPFEDDSILDINDRSAIEAIGRNKGNGLWGRTDTYADGYWRAFTTIPDRPDLAWLVLGHPKYGVSVYLVNDRDASNLYSVLPRTAVTIRNGGYWWDGTTWYRPEVYNPARGTNDTIPVPDAETIFRNPEAEVRETVRDSSVQSVLGFTAAELQPEALLTTTEAAERAGISPSTLRAYLSRGENGVPTPQFTAGAGLWSVPVIDAWVANRSRDTRSVMQTLPGGLEQPPGAARLQESATGIIRALAGRRLNDDTITNLGQRLMGTSAALHRIIPPLPLIITTMTALRDDIRQSSSYGPSFSERHLDTLHWLILHFPQETMPHIRELILLAQEKTESTPELIVESMMYALNSDDGYVRIYFDHIIEGM